MTPETERRFLDVALMRGAISKEAIERLERARELNSRERGRRRSLPQALCDEGLLDRTKAVALLREARRRLPDLPSDGPLPDATPTDGRGPIMAAGRAVLMPGMDLGPFRILDELGAGGMGVVYRARDGRLGREVALKTIAGNPSPQALERFLREGRAAARLRHPGIVTVYGAEVHEGVRVVALELVEGESLAQRIALRGPLSPHEAAKLVRDLARAVQAAHDAGVVHRDLKPANVLLEKDGRPRLVDFGLAKDEQESSLTASNEVLGTPQYMAPEQAMGTTDLVGPRTDVYGLGTVLYEALAGEPAFAGKKKLELARAIMEDPPARPTRARLRRKLASVPIDLETICLKALEKSPHDRFATAQLMSEDLDRFMEGQAIVARPARWPERARRLLSRHPRIVIAFLFAAVVLVYGSRYYERQLFREKHVGLLQDRGQRYVSERRFELALRDFDRIVQQYPDELRGYMNRALVHRLMGDPAAAAADYTKALGILDRADLFLDRGQCREDLGDTRGALADYLQAYERSGSAYASAHLGHIARARALDGDLDGAVETARKALALDPENAGAHNALALALLRKKDATGALEASARSLAIIPGYAGAIIVHAQARAALGDREGAIAEIRSALRLRWADRELHTLDRTLEQLLQD